jgi:hypothetical protein
LGDLPRLCKQFDIIHREVLPCGKTYIYSLFFVIISSSFMGEQGYGILIQTEAKFGVLLQL